MYLYFNSIVYFSFSDTFLIMTM